MNGAKSKKATKHHKHVSNQDYEVLARGHEDIIS